ncbi:M24 family metallopeptidase [Haloferax sp. DFSO60]|uniref:M24 family metallopeptidase n=1 Tax=Haloferax sp. DFSO60 TaxID=3388652 RepID=UPI00397E3486
MTPFERRVRACQRRLASEDIDALVLFPSQNLYYLTGFDESPGERHLFLFLPSEGEPVFLVPELYETQVRAESWVSDIRTWGDDDDPKAATEAVVSDLGLSDGHVLVDDTMWARFTHDLRAAIADTEFGLASTVVAPLRAQKDDAELDALRRAGEVADAVVERLREMGDDAIGMTETELARHIERLLEEAGGEGIPFGPIVGSGPNGAMPHHMYDDRIIEAGDPVVLDFGTRVDHYPSDQTRTVVFGGDPPAEFETVHEVVERAHATAIEAVEPGVTAGNIDRAAREVIEDAGYGDQFIHRTGHGVGLDVHEEPYIVADSDRELAVGNVFSIEPGIYLPDEFGVRIEDLVVVTEDGAERLNSTETGWQC